MAIGELRFIKILQIIQGSINELPRLPDGKSRTLHLRAINNYINEVRAEIVFGKELTEKVYKNEQETKNKTGNLNYKKEGVKI